MAEEPNADNVSMIAEALANKFGANAVDVARTQAESSFDGVQQTWLAVVDALSAPQTHI